MNEIYLKELLNTLRSERNSIWTLLIVVTGSTLGLLLKGINFGNGIFENILFIVGVILIFYLLNSLKKTKKDIDEILQLLKKGA